MTIKYTGRIDKDGNFAITMLLNPEEAQERGAAHYDWNGKLCGGQMVYAHKHSVYPHIAWFLCPLCSRKVCGPMPDLFFVAAQEVANNG